jgi:isochorismate synthase
VSEPVLRSRTRELGPAFDLLAAFAPGDGFFIERDGVGVATRGAAVRISEAAGEGQIARVATSVADALASVARDRDGCAPVAVGAFPFDATREAVLVVPERAVMRGRDTVTREITIGRPADPAEDARTVGRTMPFDPFDPLQLREIPASTAYEDGVRAAVAMIRAGAMRKVVLARTLEVDAGRELDARQLLHRLRAVDPSAYVFAVSGGPDPTRGDAVGVLVGASPELLVSRRGREVRANPLAGSAPRAGDPVEDRATADALASDGKNREEHAIVVDAVSMALQPFCEELAWDRTPTVVETANVWHLSTRFRGVLREPAPTAMDLLAVLHPTPAVGGAPAEVARAAIRELEPFERGIYAGPVGWVDGDGNGEWAIALRCAELHGGHATLYAGAGIVSESDPSAELDETDRKFRAFLDALRWG